MQTIYWGCNGCHKTQGPVHSEDEIPVGNVCSDECAEKYAKVLDAERKEREAQATALREGNQQPAKFHTVPE